MKTCEINGFTKNELLEMSWEKPIMAQLAITKNCNQKCVFCFRSCTPEKVFPDLSLNKWQEIVKRCSEIGIRKINFSGGESFLYRNFYRLVDYVKNIGLEVIINTNGTFDTTAVSKIADEIIFSVHGLNLVHERIVGQRGTFKVVEKNVFESSKFGVKTSVNMVLTKENFSQVLKVYRYFNDKINLYKFSPTISIETIFGSKHKESALLVNKELIGSYVETLKEIPFEKLQLKHGFQSIFIGDLLSYQNSAILLPNCAAGKHKLIIEHNGDVFPCNFFKSIDFFCGNALKNDLADIWTSGKGFLRFRKLILDKQIPSKCNECLKIEKCFSGCRAWIEGYQKGGFEYECDKRCSLGNAFIRS